jgi:hypothetical protein
VKTQKMQKVKNAVFAILSAILMVKNVESKNNVFSLERHLSQTYQSTMVGCYG